MYGSFVPTAAPSSPPVDSTASPRFARLRLLWDFARPHKRALLLGLLLALVGSGMELATPMATKFVLDSLTGAVSLALPVMVLLILLIIGSAVGLWQTILLGTVAERIVLEVREKIVRRYFRAKVLPLTQRPSGELVTRVTSDSVLLREAASSSVVGLINGAVLLIGTLILMGVLDLPLLGVTLTAVVAVTVAFGMIMPAIAKAQERAQESLGRMGGVLEGGLRALRTVKVSRAEERMSDQVLDDAHAAARHGVTAVRKEAIAWTVAGSSIQLAIIAVLGFGAYRVAVGTLEVSTLIAFLLYAFNLMWPIMQLSSEVTTLQSGIAAAARIREVEAIPLEAAADEPSTEFPPTEQTTTSAVEFHRVTARYAPDAEPAVRDIDLAIPARGHTAIVGPSGAGKTTLLALLLRFLDPEEGELAINGIGYAALSPATVRSRFAYVEQDTPVIPGTIRDNLLFTRPDADEQDVARVLRAVRLDDHIATLPAGLDTPLTATSLSGGQRQRIALGRALLRAPEVLLLDEATAQVDAITEAAITAAVREQAARSAIVTIAHRLSTVIHADRIVVMEAGRIRAVGTHDQLLGSDELYQDLIKALHISGTPNSPSGLTNQISLT